MPSFLQYHNGPRMGWLPLEQRPFLETRLGIVTRRPAVRRAVGGTVYLIVSVGRPKRYYLWERFVIESVRAEGEWLYAEGPGWQLVPPAPLNGPAFTDFQVACAHFIGFQNIDRHAFLATLEGLAARHRREEVDDAAEAFATGLIEAMPDAPDGWYARGFVRWRLGRREGAITDLEEALRRNADHAEAAQYLALARAGVTP